MDNFFHHLTSTNMSYIGALPIGHKLEQAVDATPPWVDIEARKTESFVLICWWWMLIDC